MADLNVLSKYHRNIIIPVLPMGKLWPKILDFHYKLVSLNESFCTEIFYAYIYSINIFTKYFILVLHNNQPSLKWYPCEILNTVWAFIWILIVQRQHYREIMYNTAHGQKKSHPYAQGPLAVVSNIVYKMSFPLHFLL